MRMMFSPVVAGRASVVASRTGSGPELRCAVAEVVASAVEDS